jgi:type II secretory pathway component PulJ
MRRLIDRSGTRGHGLAGCSGFTLTEVLIVAAISIGVVLSIVVAYVGTIRSWNGTAALLEIQREASLGIESIENAVRPASDLTVSSGVFGDSLEVYWEVAGGDSLAAEYYLDANGNLLDINGATVASHIDSIDFVVSGGTLHVNAYLWSDVGTPDRTTDDQRLLISSTAICRN